MPSRPRSSTATSRATATTRSRPTSRSRPDGRTTSSSPCPAPSGPGAIHLLNGLYDAKLDHQPVVAIVGQQARTAMGGEYQQEVDLVSLFKDVAHEFVQMATHPAQIRHLLDRAVRIALAM